MQRICATPKNDTAQILWRKLLRIATKPRNSWKFSPPKVSHYTIHYKLVPWGREKEILSIIYLQDRADFNDIVRMLEGQATKGGSVEVAKQEAKTTELKVFSFF